MLRSIIDCCSTLFVDSDVTKGPLVRQISPSGKQNTRRARRMSLQSEELVPDSRVSGVCSSCRCCWVLLREVPPHRGEVPMHQQGAVLGCDC